MPLLVARVSYLLAALVVEMRLVPTAPPFVRHFALLLRKVRSVRCQGGESVGIGTPVLALATRSEAFATERAHGLRGGRPIDWRVCAFVGHCVRFRGSAEGDGSLDRGLGCSPMFKLTSNRRRYKRCGNVTAPFPKSVTPLMDEGSVAHESFGSVRCLAISFLERSTSQRRSRTRLSSSTATLQAGQKGFPLDRNRTAAA